MVEYTNSQVRAIIDEHLHSARDRELLYRRLVDGITVENLAAEFDLSVSQTKRIIYRGSTTIFSHLKANGEPK